MFFLGWLLKLPLDYVTSWRLVQNNIHYRLGGFWSRSSCHSVWRTSPPPPYQRTIRMAFKNTWTFSWSYSWTTSVIEIPIWKSCAFVLTSAVNSISAWIPTNACFWCISKLLWDTLCQGKVSYWIQRKFKNCQHATTKNSKGNTSFWQNGLFLSMFHLGLCIHHGTHHQIIAENQNLWLDQRVLINMGCNLAKIHGWINTHRTQVGSELSCSH